MDSGGSSRRRRGRRWRSLGAAQGLRVWPGPWQGQGWKVQIIGYPLAEVRRILKVNLIWRRQKKLLVTLNKFFFKISLVINVIKKNILYGLN